MSGTSALSVAAHLSLALVSASSALRTSEVPGTVPETRAHGLSSSALYGLPWSAPRLSAFPHFCTSSILFQPYHLCNPRSPGPSCCFCHHCHLLPVLRPLPGLQLGPFCDQDAAAPFVTRMLCQFCCFSLQLSPLYP